MSGRPNASLIYWRIISYPLLFLPFKKKKAGQSFLCPFGQAPVVGPNILAMGGIYGERTIFSIAQENYLSRSFICLSLFGRHVIYK